MFIFANMKRLLFFTLAFFLLVIYTEESSAQIKDFVGKAKNVIGNITGSNGYDTTYIATPARPWKIGLVNKLSGFDVYNSNTLSGIGYQSFRSARTNFSIGLDATYKGFGLGFGVSPFKDSHKKKFKEKDFSFAYYSNRICFDVMYSFSPSIAGSLKKDGAWLALPDNVLEQKSMLISSYYIFNHKQFSYPAAFNQGFVQKKSAGSPLAIMLFSRCRFNINQWDVLENHFTESKLITFCAGAGYGYNFVLPHNWLIHLSSIPAISVLSVTGSELDDIETEPRPYLNTMLTQRFAVVKYLSNDHLFFSFTAYGIGLLAMKELKFSYAQVVWDSRFSFGVMF